MGLDKYIDFEKDIWFELVKAMWRNHRSVYQDHLEYIHNDILKPFLVVILRYTARVQEMHNLSKQLHSPLLKGDG